jgi:two-component system sensor histidine kinase QseC
MTIRRGLTRRLLIAVGVPLVIAGVTGYLIVRANLLARLDATLLAKAEAIVSETTWDEGRLQVDHSPRFMREFDPLDSALAHDEAANGTAAASATSAASVAHVAPSVFEIRRANGEMLARSPSLAGGDMPTSSRTPVRDKPAFWNLTLPAGVPARALTFAFVPRMPHEGSPPGPIHAILVVATDRSEIDRTLNLLGSVLAGVGVLLASAIALAIAYGLRRELAPLDALAEQASRIDATSLAIRFPVDALPGELWPIADRLNALLGRLEQSFEREREFSANVAHELRTPLAELRTAAELALAWPDARHADTDRETLAIARQMEGIVSRLLALLRSERGLLPLTSETLHLAEMLRAVWQPFASGAAAKGLEVIWRVEETISIQSDPVLLRSIITNLLENAAEYTPAGGSIWIEAERTPRFSLRVANTIDSATPPDVSKLFDRFWRHDAARSSGEHVGLGLSLARTFAGAMGYELTASVTADGRQLAFLLSGPVDS